MIIRGNFCSEVSTRKGEDLVGKCFRLDAITKNPYDTWSEKVKILSFNPKDNIVRIKIDSNCYDINDISYVILCDGACIWAYVDKISDEQHLKSSKEALLRVGGENTCQQGYSKGTESADRMKMNYGDFAIALGIKPKEIIDANVPTGDALELNVFLRHDKSSDHWAGLDCARFKDIAHGLSNIIRRHKLPKELQNQIFLEFLNEILSENDATYETLQGINNPDFSRWLCKLAFCEYNAIQRDHFTFKLTIINQFPVIAENGKICFVGRIFQKWFCKKLRQAHIEPQILDAIEQFHNRWYGAWEEDTASLTENFRSLSLPIYDTIFGLTDIDETKGDDLFRYIVLEPGLGADTTLRTIAKENLTINHVSVYLGRKEVLNWNCERHLRAREETLLSNPQDPWDISAYENIIHGGACRILISGVSNSGKWEKEYDLRGKDQEVFSLSIGSENKSRAFVYADIFVDMGSTYSKMLTIRLNKDDRLSFQSINQNCKQHCETISFLNRYGLTDLVASLMSIQKDAILEKAVIVDFKKRMACDPDSYSKFLSEAIKRIARIYIKEDVIINSVCWSFPKTPHCANEFFSNVEREVRQNIIGYTHASNQEAFQLYPEHEALRYMFDAPIKSIAKQARESKVKLLKAIDTIRANRNKQHENVDKKTEIEIKEKTKEGFWAALRFVNARMRKKLKKKADDEKASITEKAREEMDALNESFNKQEWIATGILLLHLLQDNSISSAFSYGYVDAGGYSLDSVVRAASGRDILGLTRSFEAGGERLLAAVAEKIVHLKNPTNEEKAKILKSLKDGAYDDDKEFSSLLEDIYGEYINLFRKTFLCGRKVSDDVGRSKGEQEQSSGKQELGYMVFSGGVANNSAFQDLFNPELTNETLQIKNDDPFVPLQLKTTRIQSPKISSESLYRLVSQINLDVTDETLEVFRRIVTHHDTGKPCEIYDVVGGMLFHGMAK